MDQAETAHGAGLFPFAHMDGGKSWCFGTVSNHETLVA